MIVVTEQPIRNRCLTTVAKLKQQAQIVGETEDGWLEDLCLQATEELERFCNRIFRWRTVTESLPSSGGSELLLSCRPIVELTGIAFQGIADDVTGVLVTDPEAGIIFRRSGFGSTRPLETFMVAQSSPYSAAPDWAVDYTGGFVCLDPNPPTYEEGEEDPEPVPPDGVPALPANLVRLATDFAVVLYDDRKRNTLRKSESEGDANASYLSPDEWLEQRASRWRCPV